MLYLVRKLNESIIINDNIEIKIVEIKGKSVKIGFEFPDDATVLRKEVHDRIAQENKSAAISHDDFADIEIPILSTNSDKTTLKLGNISTNVRDAVAQGLAKARDKNQHNELHKDINGNVKDNPDES